MGSGSDVRTIIEELEALPKRDTFGRLLGSQAVEDIAPDVKHFPSRWHFIAERTADLVKTKNAAYGNSFEQSGEFMAMLYPDGVKPEQMKDFLCIVRVMDKIKRISTKKDAFGENPWQDILGYALLTLEQQERNGTNK